MTTTHRAPAPRPGLAARTIIGYEMGARAKIIGVAGFYMLAMGALVGALWPALRDVFAEMPGELTDLIAALSGGTDLSTGAGWANAEMMSMIAPAAVIVTAIMGGAATTAGEEQRKTLGMVLSTPMRRSSLLAAKMVAATLQVLLVGTTISLGLWLGQAIGDLGLTAGGIIGGGIHSFMLGMVFVAVTHLLGVWTGSRIITTAAAAALAAAAFAANIVIPLSDNLDGLERFNPWYHYLASDPVGTGTDWSSVLVLGAITVVIAAAAFPVFARRDLRG